MAGDHKQRVLETIAHREPDRVPVGEWGIDHDHVSRILGRHTFWRNRRDTTLALWQGRRDEVVESMKVDYAELVEALDYDLVTVPLAPPKLAWEGPPPKEIQEGVWEDHRGNFYKYAASNDSIACLTQAPEREELSEEDVARAEAAAVEMDESVFELLDYFGARYGEERAVLFRDLDIYSGMLEPFGGDYLHQMIVIGTAPEEIVRLRHALFLKNCRMVERCAMSGVTVAMQGHDFCMNGGPIFSPGTFREVFLPLMGSLNEVIKAAGMHCFFHCCGDTTSLLKDFVDVGYEGYQSIQATAGVDYSHVKKTYGDRLTMWTGVQCETLVEGSREQVRDEVLGNLELLMPGGGFIFGSTNSVQFGANTDNYLYALDLVRKHGVY